MWEALLPMDWTGNDLILRLVSRTLNPAPRYSRQFLLGVP